MHSLLFNKENNIKATDFNKLYLKDDLYPIIGYWNNLKTLRPKVKKEQEEFYDMMKILSHDIRTPLVIISAALKLLKKGVYGEVDKGVYAELDRLFEIVIRNGSAIIILEIG